MAEENPGVINIVKLTSDYDADVNIPGLLVPYRGDGTGPDPEHLDEPSWLDLAGGYGQVFIEVNGVPKLCGKDEASGTFYPGTNLRNGDVKCNEALSTGDIIVIQYGSVRYRELPAS
jgi:hypothetical protein